MTGQTDLRAALAETIVAETGCWADELTDETGEQ